MLNVYRFLWPLRLVWLLVCCLFKEVYLQIFGTLEIVIHEVLWSIRLPYSAIWSLPLTNVKWHSDPWTTVTSQPIRLSTKHLYTELDLHRIMSGFHGAFAAGVACQQGTLTLPDTWFRPSFWDLLVLQLLRPDSANLPCLYSTFHHKYPLVLSRFCLLNVCPFYYTAFAGSGKVGPVNKVNHISWVAVVTPTDRPKSVRNRCVIELICGVVCVVTLPFWYFCWCRGFRHRTESDLFPFLKNGMINCLTTNFIVIIISYWYFCETWC